MALFIRPAEARSTPASTTVAQSSDASSNRVPFLDTGLGSLPNELLQLVAENLPCCDLAAMARVCANLHLIAERQLYETIVLTHRDGTNGHRRLPVSPTMLPNLYETLTQHPRLASRTLALDLGLYDRGCEIELQTSNILS
jgi:hypothetical protein